MSTLEMSGAVPLQMSTLLGPIEFPNMTVYCMLWMQVLEMLSGKMVTLIKVIGIHRQL